MLCDFSYIAVGFTQRRLKAIARNQCYARGSNQCYVNDIIIQMSWRPIVKGEKTNSFGTKLTHLIPQINQLLFFFVVLDFVYLNWLIMSSFNSIIVPVDFSVNSALISFLFCMQFSLISVGALTSDLGWVLFIQNIVLVYFY